MIFRVDNGSYSWGTKEILRNLSFEITSGQILAILGPNGVGKTTLLRCMMGLLPWSEGYSSIDGRKLSDISYREFWSRVSYVPQAKNLTFGYSALEMVVMGLGAHIGLFGQPRPEDYEHAYSCLETLGVERLAKKACTQMSGGELQMVLIARALISDPELLILDEPESGLDFKNQLTILETLKKLQEERRIASILNTHYPEHALKISDLCLMLRYDKSSVFGPCSEIITESSLRQTFDVQVAMGTLCHEGQRHAYVLPVSVVQEERLCS